jgi:hypothetical protein
VLLRNNSTHAPKFIANMLKLPPKGGGFDPPKWRQ